MIKDEVETIESFAAGIRDTARNGGTVYIFGNGGSASQADHFAGELLGRFRSTDRPPIRAHCLSNEVGALTATANDFEYAAWPQRFLSACFIPSRDMFIGLSTSGMSENVTRAIRVVTQARGYCAIMTGERGDPFNPLSPLYDCRARVLASVVSSLDVCDIQEATIRCIHEVCKLLEPAAGWVQSGFDLVGDPEGHGEENNNNDGGAERPYHA